MKLKLLGLFLAGLLTVSCAAPPSAPAENVSSVPGFPTSLGEIVSQEAPLPDPVPDPALREQQAQTLAPLVEEICQNRYVTGMTLAVFDKDGVFYEQSYGYAVRENGTSASPDTIYRIASISKSVTALLALDLAGQGKLETGTPLSQLMGYSLENPAYPGQGVTLEHLLTHTSGIVDSAAYLDALDQPVLPPLSTVLPRSWSCYAPGEHYSYSNFAMGLVSGVVEKAAGTPFLDYTRDEVFGPMGIDAAYSYTDIQHKERVADIYQSGERTVNMATWSNMSAKYTGLPLGDLYCLGHGDLFITARDLARFAMIMAGCPQEGEPVSLTPELLERMQTVQYSQTEPTDTGITETMRGLGTQITDHLLEGQRMVGHQGNAYGSICGMFFDPEAKNGFVFLTNGASAAANEAGVYLVNRDIAEAVYTAFFGYEAPQVVEISASSEPVLDAGADGEEDVSAPSENPRQ
jgi:D-alanyl-D-alanine carboxypeptidase